MSTPAGSGNTPADVAAEERRKRTRTVVGGAMLAGGLVILAVAFVVYREMRAVEPTPAVPMVAGENSELPDTGVPIPAVVLACAGALDFMFGMVVLAFGLPGDWKARREGSNNPDFNPYNRR